MRSGDAHEQDSVSICDTTVHADEKRLHRCEKMKGVIIEWT